MSGLRHKMKEVRGLGSAKSGVGHWWWQRLTAVVLMPLGLWFVYSLIQLLPHAASREAVAAWLASPANTLGMIALLAAMFYHSKLGIQTIIEDYVHKECCKISLLILNTLGHLGLTLVSTLAVIKLHFGI